MNCLRFILALFLGITTAFAETDVAISLRDSRLQIGSYANRGLWIQPKGFPTSISPSIVLGPPIITQTDVNGGVTLSNLQVGAYLVTIQAPPVRQNFAFAVTSTNLGMINAADNLAVETDSVYPPGSTAWSITSSDSKYAPIGSGGSATNVPDIRTNAVNVFTGPSNVFNGTVTASNLTAVTVTATGGFRGTADYATVSTGPATNPGASVFGIVGYDSAYHFTSAGGGAAITNLLTSWNSLNYAQIVGTPPSNSLDTNAIAAMIGAQIALTNAPPSGLTNWYVSTTLWQSNTTDHSFGFLDADGNAYWTNAAAGWSYYRTNGQIWINGVALGTGGGSSGGITNGSAYLSLDLTRTNSFVGNAGNATLSTANSDTAQGVHAQSALTVGYDNTASGAWAQQSLTSGYQNTAFGFESQQVMTDGYFNTAVGALSQQALTTSFMTAYGYMSQMRLIDGQDNVALGHFAQQYMVHGSGNTAVGNGAQNNNNQETANPVENTGIGNFSQFDLTSGSYNTSLGSYSQENITSNSLNVAVGGWTQNRLVTGSNDVAVGYDAQVYLTSGTYDVAIGGDAQHSMTTGSYNVAIGENAQWNANGANNVGVGAGAEGSLTTGNNNVALGNYALYLAQTNSDNIGLGHYAGYYVLGGNNIEIGNQGLAGDTNIIRIGTAQTDTYLVGTIHGDGTVTASNLTAGASTFTGQVMNTNATTGNYAIYDASKELRTNVVTGSYFLGTNGSATWFNGANSNSIALTNGNGTFSGTVTANSISVSNYSTPGATTWYSGSTLIVSNSNYTSHYNLSDGSYYTVYANGQSNWVSTGGVLGGNGAGLSGITSPATSIIRSNPSPISLTLSAPTRLVAVGDSLTTGVTGAESKPYLWWLPIIWPTTNLVCINLGSGGTVIEDGISSYASVTAAYKPSGGTNAWIGLWYGVNNLYYGSNYVTSLTDYSNYVVTALC